MTPFQVAALEKFLAHNNFEYCDYDEEAGVLIYSLSTGNWTMEVAYGDECYYRLYNDLTEEAICEEFTNVSEVMTKYKRLYRLKQLLERQSTQEDKP